jgi:hypothetical protein
MANAQRSKEWRARKEAEDPAYMELQRSKARERSLARYNAMKNDPEFIERERVRKRELQARRRADPEKNAKIRAAVKKSMQDPQKREAQNKRTAEWKKANAERVQAYSRRWNEENREHVSAYNVAYMSEYKKTESFRNHKHRSRMKRYGLTNAEFNAMWESQNGCCAICNVKLEPRGRSKHSAAIDHNHKTSEVRGILCRGCNHGIGSLGDSPSVLIAAARYLEEKGYYGKKGE